MLETSIPNQKTASRLNSEETFTLPSIYIPILGLNERKTQQAIEHLRTHHGLSELVIGRIMPKTSDFITRLATVTSDPDDCKYFPEYEMTCLSLRKEYGDKHWRYISKTLESIGVVHVNHSYSNGYNDTEPFAKKYKLLGHPEKADENLALLPRELLHKHLMAVKRKRRNASHTLDTRKALNAIYKKHLPDIAYTQQQLRGVVRDVHFVARFLRYKHFKNSNKLTKRGICRTGRQYMTLSFMPKYLRAMITYKGKPTVQIDFSACAPTTLYLLIEDSKERAIWRDLVEGDIYTSLSLEMPREAVKKAFVTFIGGRHENALGRHWDSKTAYQERDQLRLLIGRLRQLVPKSSERFEEMRKSGDLIRFTQEVESKIVIPITKEFKSAESIHDCILCSVEEAEEVEKVMKKRFEKEVGLKAKVTREG